MKAGFRNTKRSLFYGDLRVYALRMRNNPTEAEQLLWSVLSGGKLGVKFRRQHIIGDCIADFACVSKGLVVEIDGGYHSDSEQRQVDQSRTDYLKERGFNVVRFTNEQVFNELNDVIQAIEAELDAQ